MADALASPIVAGGAGVVAAGLIAVAAHKVRDSRRDDIIPLMGVMGAFVFAAQMINFSIPGTGSSGHIIGGILLAAVVGPWAAFITLCSVLIIQCLIFADGGLLTLGCNMINMAATSCLLAYPLIFKPVAGKKRQPWRLMCASVMSSVIALEIGALGVTAETEISGITALPTGLFMSFMLPIHLAIGAVEGLATGAVICFLAKYSPDTLWQYDMQSNCNDNNKSVVTKRRMRKILIGFTAVSLLLAGSFAWLASSDPDGLEWSVAKVAGEIDMESMNLPTAIMPGYDSTLAGIIGAGLVMMLLWAVSSLLFHSLRYARANSRRRQN